MRMINIGDNPHQNIKENTQDNSKGSKNPIVLLLVIPLLIGAILLGNYVSNKTGKSIQNKKKEIINNKIEEEREKRIKGEFVIEKECFDSDEVKYVFNDKEQTAKLSNRESNGTTAPSCNYEIKKEKGTYSFNEFINLYDDEISIFNWTYNYEKKFYTVSTTLDGRTSRTYKIDYKTNEPKVDDYLYFKIKNNKIKDLELSFIEGESFYITITKDSIIFKSDKKTTIRVDADTKNDNKGHSKLLNIELNNNQVEIKANSNNQYTITKDNETKKLPLTYRVKFIENDSIDVDVEEGNKLPKPETREEYYWKCQGSNSEEKEWNFDTDTVKEDLFCREYKKN